jgi:hypothetical protein
MSTIHPEMISIISVKVFKSNFETTEEYLNKPEKPSGVEIKLGQNTAYNLTEKNIRIRLLVNLQATKNETDKLGLTADFGIEFHIHVENLEQFITEKNETKLIDRKLGGVISGIVYSTARGIILERTSTTFFNSVVLPVIDPNLLLENK